jgi:hypothetical protein
MSQYHIPRDARCSALLGMRQRSYSRFDVLIGLTSRPAVTRKQRVLDIRQIDHDVFGRAAGQPPQFFRRAHIGFEMGNEGRDEHEIALRHLDIFLIILAEVDTGAAGQQIGTGLGLAVMVRQ